MEHGTFLGWIGDDVLHSLYRIADLTVVPSIYEPFGLVALEAMASGCPCIVADTGGLREVVPHEEAGLRFRARDPEELAEAAIRVLSDDELGAAWSPKPTSTCAASTGPTSPSRRPRSTPSWRRAAPDSAGRDPRHAGSSLAVVGAIPRAGPRRHVEPAREPDQGVDADDPLTALDQPDLGPVQRGESGQLLLGDPRLLADPAQVDAEPAGDLLGLLLLRWRRCHGRRPPQL